MNTEKKAIVNPKFLYSHGLEFSLSRMKIHSWSTLQTKLPKTNLDVFSLFGPSDLICRYYHAGNFTVEDLMREENIPEPFYSDVNKFHVERIDKIEGIELDWESNVKKTPTLADLIAIEALQKNWDAPKANREQLIKHNMILPVPIQKSSQKEPLLAFIFMKILGFDTAEGVQLCRSYLRTSLFKNWWSNIRGLFWGYPHAHYQCVVELEVENLTTLVRFVMGDLQKSFPKGVETATNIVIEHLATGSIKVRQLFKRLPEKFEFYGMEALTLDKILDEKTEGPHVEFKSSLRWDYKENRVNKDLVWTVVKEISAFMNTEGGVVLIGVNDSGVVVGIEKDLESLSKSNIDGLRLTLAQGITDYLGAEFIRNINIVFARRQNQQVCVVRVQKSNKPAYIKSKTKKDKEFYIRTDNSSRPLDMETAISYINMQWPLLS